MAVYLSYELRFKKPITEDARVVMLFSLDDIVPSDDRLPDKNDNLVQSVAKHLRFAVDSYSVEGIVPTAYIADEVKRRAKKQNSAVKYQLEIIAEKMTNLTNHSNGTGLLPMALAPEDEVSPYAGL